MATGTTTTTTAEETALAAPSDHDLRVPYYCEENVWRLTYRKKHTGDCQEAERLWVVFISNTLKSVPMFHQRASPDPNQSVCWDYHVISLAQQGGVGGIRGDPNNNSNSTPGNVWVYDMDSSLPYPCSLYDYLRFSFPYDWPPPLGPLFRVVDADLYLQYFSSDRMHMYNQKLQNWKAPPPTYASIQAGGCHSHSNLDQYLNFVDRPVFTELVPMDDTGTGAASSTASRAFGTIWSLSQFREGRFLLVS